MTNPLPRTLITITFTHGATIKELATERRVDWWIGKFMDDDKMERIEIGEA